MNLTNYIINLRNSLLVVAKNLDKLNIGALSKLDNVLNEINPPCEGASPAAPAAPAIMPMTVQPVQQEKRRVRHKRGPLGMTVNSELYRQYKESGGQLSWHEWRTQKKNGGISSIIENMSKQIPLQQNVTSVIQNSQEGNYETRQ